MLEAEFEKEFQHIKDEIYAATLSWHSYLTIHNEAHANERLLDVMNRHPSFWLITLRAHLHNTIIVLGRLFDRTRGTGSIQRFAKEVADHKGFFTKDALEARRIKNDPDFKTRDYYATWMAKAYVPDEKHLTTLVKEADECTALWNSAYDDFRNKIVAHRARLSKEDIDGVYGKTRVGDITRILERLYNIEKAIRELLINAKALDFSDEKNPRVVEAVNATKSTLESLLKGAHTHSLDRPAAP